MDIRKLMDLLENIEKKDEPEMENPPEVEKPVHNKPKLEPVDDDSDIESDDEDSDEDSEDSESSNSSGFKSYAHNLGDGLYIVSPWMYLSSYENSWEQVLGYNNSIMHEIESLANSTDSDISELSDISDKQITRDRMFACAIYNEKTDKVFVIKASFKMNDKASYYPSLIEMKNEGTIEDNQEKKLNHILNVAKKWASSIPEYYTAREDATALSDNPSKYKSWSKNETELMGILKQKNVKDDLGPAEVVNTEHWSDERKELSKKRGMELLKKIMAQREKNQDSDPRGKR